MLHKRLAYPLRHPGPDSCFYSTPRAVTEVLLNYWKPSKGAAIWEPACGTGAISDVLKEKGYKVTSTDLTRRGYGHPDVDFLTTRARSVDYIITNPPFHLVDLFIARAAKINLCNEKVKGFAFLIPAPYFYSAGHAETFTDFRPKYILPVAWTTKFQGVSAVADVNVNWVIWEGESKRTTFDILKRPKRDRIRKTKKPVNNDSFEKVTFNLTKGDKEILADCFSDEGWSVGAREVLRNFCRRPVHPRRGIGQSKEKIK